LSGFRRVIRCDPTAFTKDRDRLQEGDVFQKFMSKQLNHPQVKPLLSDEQLRRSVRRNGLAVAGTVMRAIGTAERRASEHMLKRKSKEAGRTITVGKARLTTVRSRRRTTVIGVTPHVAQNNATTKTVGQRRSAVDGRTTRQGYGIAEPPRGDRVYFGPRQAARHLAQDKQRGLPVWPPISCLTSSPTI